jgi:thymidine kinase
MEHPEGRVGELILILGPMASAKSLMMYSHFAPLAHTDIIHGLFIPKRDTRDTEEIQSRSGVSIKCIKTESLDIALSNEFAIIGVDEIHMFDPEQATIIKRILLKGTDVIASGLDMDYRGVMYEIVRRLLELGPKSVDLRKAVCYVCKKPEASFTQILDETGTPITGGLPSIISDDGTHPYGYRSVCLKHFVKNNPA